MSKLVPPEDAYWIVTESRGLPVTTQTDDYDDEGYAPWIARARDEVHLFDDKEYAIEVARVSGGQVFEYRRVD